MKKQHRQQFGWMLMLVGLGTLAVFTLAFSLHRFANENLTETQLMIWSLQRWWGWVPATVALMAGGYLVRE